MKLKGITGIMPTVLLISILALAFNIQSDETEAYNNGGSRRLSVIREGAVGSFSSVDTFAFYYPWYGTPDVSGYWRAWDGGGHDPDNFLDGRRDIAAKHYPLLGVYDSNNVSLIEKHIEIAKMANIDCFVVSWWGIGSFTDNALFRIRNVCEQNDFKFTVYYETTSGVSNTVNDILYLLDNYADSSSWYKIDDRPVIYVYGRAVNQLNPTIYWNIDGDPAFWSLSEDMREPPRYGIFVIHPYTDGVGYVETNMILLPPNETYSLKLAISDFHDDCPPYSDVGFRIKIKNETTGWETLDDLVVNFNDGWLDLSYNISSYASQTVSVRVESYAGGEMEWCSEWAAVDYFYIINSKGEIINEGPYFDNEWKTVVNNLNQLGYNPYLIMDFGGVAWPGDFAEYFLNFTDGMHIYAPFGLSMSDISKIYNEASYAAHSKNKFFVATVMPGYDDTAIRSPGYVVDRENGAYYIKSWSIAKACFPDGYVITSFNEWHEGTEIEPSLEYKYQYINLTKIMRACAVQVFNVAWDEEIYQVTVVSNSTVTDFNFSRPLKQISFNVTGTNTSTGFCYVTIPKELLWCDSPEGWIIKVDTTPVSLDVTQDEDFTYVYFTYNHSQKTVYITGTYVIPEFPSFLILPLFMIATLLAVIVYRRKHSM